MPLLRRPQDSAQQYVTACPCFGDIYSPAPYLCSLRQAWGSVDALVGLLRVAFEENSVRPESNPSPRAPCAYTWSPHLILYNYTSASSITVS
jgi:hypothetical protein